MHSDDKNSEWAAEWSHGVFKSQHTELVRCLQTACGLDGILASLHMLGQMSK